MFSRVFKFNQEVVGLEPRKLDILEREEKAWLASCLREEVTELEISDQVVHQVDAVIDSIIFAMGGLFRLGLTEEQAQACFDAVMDANFEKKAGQLKRRFHKGVADAVKPEGWVGPEQRIAEILNVEIEEPEE